MLLQLKYPSCLATEDPGCCSKTCAAKRNNIQKSFLIKQGFIRILLKELTWETLPQGNCRHFSTRAGCVSNYPQEAESKGPLAVRVASWSNAIAQHLPHLEANLGVRWRMRGELPVASLTPWGTPATQGMPFSL